MTEVLPLPSNLQIKPIEIDKESGVRPKTIRPPTPNIYPRLASATPTKRARSADSSSSPSSTSSLTRYHFEETLPEFKRNKFIEELHFYQTAITDSKTKINSVQVLINQSTDKTHTEFLEKEIQIKREEHKILVKSLDDAKTKINNLQIDSVKTKTASEQAIQVARYRTENLDKKLQTLIQEKSILAASLQFTIQEKQEVDQQSKKAIAILQEREIALRSEHQIAIKKELEKFSSHIETTKAQHKNEIDALITENQNLKRDFARQTTILGETEQEVNRLGATLFGTQTELKTVNSHYQQSLSESHANFNENIQLKRVNETLTNDYKTLKLQYKTLNLQLEQTKTPPTSANPIVALYEDANKKLFDNLDKRRDQTNSPPHRLLLATSAVGGEVNTCPFFHSHGNLIEDFWAT